MNPKQVGEFIQNLRKQKKLTQSELSEIIGVTDKAISRWETGEGFPEITILPKLATVLGVSIDEILNAKHINIKENDDQRHISRFNLYTLINVVLIVSGYLLGVTITNLSNNIWYGLIPIILFDLGALIYYLFIRTFYIEKCIWNDLEKKTLFENTFMIYLSLITTFGMYSPYILFDIYMLVSTGVSIGILHIGGYLLSTILFAAISLGIGYVIRLIHLSKAYKKPLSKLFYHYLNNIIIFVFAFLSVNLSNILFQQLGLIIIMICLVCYWIIGLSSNKFRLSGIYLFLVILAVGILSTLNYMSSGSGEVFMILSIVMSIFMLSMAIYSIFKLSIPHFVYYFGWLTVFVISFLPIMAVIGVSLVWFIFNNLIIYLINQRIKKIKTP